MRKIIFSVHVSLDGFVAGPNREMDWIKFDEELFDLVGTMTDNADTALYGRVTYEMMEAYWPGAGKEPNDTKHTKEHAVWYNNVPKVVLSKTLDEKTLNNTHVIAEDVYYNINELKQQEGKDIIIIGSPSVVQTLLKDRLIDSFRLFVNPIILGAGIKLFTDIPSTSAWKLLDSKTFECGVIALHYEKL